MAELSAELFVGRFYSGYYYTPDFLPLLFDESDILSHSPLTTDGNLQFGSKTTAEKAISKLERSGLHEDLLTDRHIQRQPTST